MNPAALAASVESHSVFSMFIDRNFYLYLRADIMKFLYEIDSVFSMCIDRNFYLRADVL
jgi:hypothetical protein